MKINEVLTEAGMIDNLVANIKSVTTKDPRLASMTTDQKVDYFLRQPGMQKASDLARQVWEKQIVATMSANQAAGRGLTSISDQEYRNMLNNFVEKNLINSKITDLDNENQQRVNSAVVNVLRAKGADDQRDMDAAFDDLVSVASVARVVDSSVAQSAPTSQTPPAQNTGVSMGLRKAKTNAEQILDGTVGLRPNQIKQLGSAFQQQAGTKTVRSTGNNSVDGMLLALGFDVR
jgi:hypothetical protein